MPVTDLAITKDDGSATYTAGNAISYTIVVSNNGPSSAIGASVADSVPASITGLTIGCVATGSASCGVNGSAGNNVSFTGVNITAGAGNFITITVSGTVNPNTTGNLVNTATVSVGAGQVDLTPGNNSATDTDTPNPIADLAVQKNGPVTVAPNGTVVYTIRVSNAGPSAANGASVTDPFPGALSSVTWVCNATTGGATCGVPAGSGNINTTVAIFPPGGSVTYTVTGTAPASGTFDNTATVAPPQGVTDPNSSNNNSTVTTGVGPTPTTADLAVVKSGPSTVTASGSLTYTIVVTNAGPGAANGATVMDTVPAGITGVTWTCGNATAGAVCGAPNGAGNVINTTVSTFPAGASVTYTVMGTAPATGTFTNTVNVATPGGVTDPNPANNTSSVGTTVQNSPTVADLYAVKTGPSTVGPNAAITYKVIVGNSGPASVTNAPFSDIVPAAVTGVNWTCGSATAGASCGTPSGSGNTISFNIASLPAGSTVTLTITGTGPASGSFVNSATIQPPPGVTDPDPTDNIGGPVITNVVVVADLSITKTDNSNTYTPGSPVTYTIVVTNNGPDAMAGVVVADNKPAQVTQWTWVCSGTTGGAAGCDDVVNSAVNFSDTVDLPSGATITYTVTATIPPSATGNLVNTATVTNPPGTTDPNPGNNSATDTDTPAPAADLSIVKDDGSLTYTPGGSTIYTIVVTNNGPSNVANIPVTDTLPAAVTSATWTCVASPGSSCIAPNGSGNISTFVNLVSGGVAIFQVTAQISPNAIGNLVNTANVGIPQGVFDPNPANNSSTDTDTPTPMADLVINKTDNAATYTAGTSTTYTIVVTNNGPSGVSNAAVMDNLPAGITNATWSCVATIGGNCDASFGVGNINTTVDLAPGATATFTLIAQISPSVNDTLINPAFITSATWTCVASAGSSCGAANGAGNIASTVSLLPGGTATYTVTAQINPAAVGTLVNTATVTPPQGPPVTTDPNPGNNSSTDTDTPAPVADLSVTKTDGSTVYTAGTNAVYTMVVSNNGPSNITNATVTDTLPAGQVNVAGASWTCLATAGSFCVPGGSGNIATTINLIVGGSATFTYTVPVLAGSTGNLTNTVTVAPPNGATDPNHNNNTASDTDMPFPQADLGIVKTGPATYTPGATVVYTIVATNNGPSTINGGTVTDLFPAAITAASWTCNASAGSSCTLPNGNGNINTTVNLLPAGTATFSVTAQINPTATGNLVNTATVTTPQGTTDTVPGNNSSTWSSTPAPSADLRIAKTDGSPTYVPGGSTTYTIVATNDGPSAVTGANVSDSLPVGATSGAWTCVASAGSTCTASNGTGAINTTVNLLPTGTATFTLTVQIASSATGNLVNTATVTVPSNTTDPNPGNNTATDTDTPAPQADLSITKTDGQTTAVPGQTVTYTIVATNNGPSDVTNATVVDTLPATLSGATWTCAASG
ncbi:MAG: DUF11 domain-containing protein [Acidobacteria bacterium]|nr:DUF11 domain-containing protein [Acidobacteriota bacterium]